MMPNERLPLFPITTQYAAGAQCTTNKETTHLTIAGHRLANLADEYGTPLYLFDQATMDDAVDQYRSALAAHYPGNAEITYAGKAFLCVAAAQWADRSGLWLDCTGRTELHIANVAKVDRERILVHGVNKSDADLEAALQLAKVIVVDNLQELNRLTQLLQPLSTEQRPDLWIRMRPGYAVDTHEYNQTGQEDSKFGMSAEEAHAAIEHALENELAVTGMHFHQGSHFHDPAPVAPALDNALDLIVSLRNALGWLPDSFSPGGGWGVPYHEDDLPHRDIDDYIGFMTRHFLSGCDKRNLPYPRLHIEPGRSLIARAGVALYTVGAVKQTANRRWLLIDGGIADNPRHALYRTRYSALPIVQPDRKNTGPAWIAGPYCESGDVLIEDLPMPALDAGERIAVPVSGVYQLMLSSNYNGACKPAIVWITEEAATLVQKRQTPEDILARDMPLPPTL